VSRGHINFPDEVQLGEALTRIHNTPAPAESKPMTEGIQLEKIRQIIHKAGEGYLEPEEVSGLLDAAGIPRVKEIVLRSESELERQMGELSFPLALKVVGPVHKSDVGGVVLGIAKEAELRRKFASLMEIQGAEGVLIQPMLQGMELFAGASYEPYFGHVVLCGLGGIFVEILKDVASGLAPLSVEEARRMIKSLKTHRMMTGYRGQEGVDTDRFAEILVRLSSLLRHCTEIAELDLNPIMGRGKELAVVDARIRIQK
jgi:acyl-CoA synthetase (NDP forming)